MHAAVHSPRSKQLARIATLVQESTLAGHSRLGGGAAPRPILAIHTSTTGPARLADPCGGCCGTYTPCSGRRRSPLHDTTVSQCPGCSCRHPPTQHAAKSHVRPVETESEASHRQRSARHSRPSGMPLESRSCRNSHTTLQQWRMRRYVLRWASWARSNRLYSRVQKLNEYVECVDLPTGSRF